MGNTMIFLGQKEKEKKKKKRRKKPIYWDTSVFYVLMPKAYMGGGNFEYKSEV